jgi:uncharacterized phage protein gp47/JayE
MANYFKQTSDIVQEMCDDFQAITGTTLDKNDVTDERVAKFYPFAGALSTFYAKLQQVYDNIFPASSDEESLRRDLAARQLADQKQPQSSNGKIKITGTNGTVVPAGSQIKRLLDGAIYVTQASATIGSVVSGYVEVTVESAETGADKNLDQLNQPFTLISTISGADQDCVNTTQLLDGRDLETADEMLVRIQIHDRDENSGGNLAAYEAWARESNAEVVTAKAIKQPRGPSTVDVVITSGTTDIAAAVNNDEAVTRLPSNDLIAAVQTYIEGLNPVTDDVLVLGPTEQSFNVTMTYKLYNDSPANRSSAEQQLLKIIKIFIYSAQSQQTISPTDLERSIDTFMADLLKERTVANFDGLVAAYTVPDDAILSPGTITITAV